MSLFICKKCNFSTNIKCNYERHLLTKKHINNENSILKNVENVEKMLKIVENCEKNVENSKKKIRDNKEKNSLKSAFNTEIKENLKLEISTFLNEKKCNFCCKILSRKDSLLRHLSSCKIKNYSQKNTEKHLILKKNEKNEKNENLFETKVKKDEKDKNNENLFETQVKKNEKNENLFETQVKKDEKDKNNENLFETQVKKNEKNENLFETQIKKNEKNENLFETQVKKNEKNESDENKINLLCQFCFKTFNLKTNTLRHENKCFKKKKELLEMKYKYEFQLKEINMKTKEELLKKDIELEKALNKEKDKTIELIKDKNLIINNHQTNNKTINYLNYKFGNMINMERFLFNLEHNEQLTTEERKQLLIALDNCGIEVFARNFSYIMKENCKRQLIKEGIQGYNMIPLYCSDSNLRSHKEKKNEGWKSCYNNQSINSMINISSDQVYETYSKPLLIVGKSREKIYKQVKQDNCENKKKYVLKKIL